MAATAARPLSNPAGTQSMPERIAEAISAIAGGRFD
jgi:hypothetical protein